MAGGVGVADIQRNVLLSHGEHRALVQHLRAHIAQLAQLVIGYALDGVGIIDDARIGHEYARYVRPVFVHVRVQRRSRKSARNIASAA